MAPLFDVSGAAGNSGQHAIGYDSRGFGKNATSGTAGRNAGSINIELRSSSTATGPTSFEPKVDGGRTTNVNNQYTMGAYDMIQLKAKGGDGGSGGDGGEGQRGTHGSKGRDAKQYLPGEDGGQGGPGKPGGDAGAGANGGNGGTIVVTVRKEDVYLLSLLEPTPVYSGGRGGKAGKAGAGGPGGYGGAGGNSYSWSETRTYRDSQGNVQATLIQHNSPGGARGLNGPAGSPGKAAPSGTNGTDGSVQFRIVSADGTRIGTYSSLFNLRLESCLIVPEVWDGPWAEPRARWLVLSSRLRISAKDWIVSSDLDHFVVLPGSIEPGKKVEVAPCLMGSREHAGQPLSFYIAASKIRFSAQVAPFGRDLAAFCGLDGYSADIPVRYPIELSPIHYLSSLLPGVERTCTFTIRNLAESSNGLLGESKRGVLLRVHFVSGDITLEGLKFRSDHPFTFSKFDRVGNSNEEVQFSNLLANTTFSSRVYFKLPEEAIPYTSGLFAFSLYLDSADGSERTAIQRREVAICTSASYRRTPGATTLLVTNAQTTAPEVQAWKSLATLCHGPGPAAAVDEGLG
ncbi:hypothetical protein M427DRAFT_35800 [Gonapodya prolifera JEL478]|uniref:Uncharacterized protein n=1 Tax=Gonapodya prolifera (strain JEL478) TaxID=1344416 RepID=A0A139A3R0_GONPJ|nr:hypothetical protein M427DRAFT_35800 [Gonapodya prolifera JEL478]|eukprot:KXS11420.1 hypothetical protein M427DRAFT_35800 [Gonapodya prolifera JEL478]